MPADLEDQMLHMLQSRSSTAAPLTIADFARTFGANRELITLCAQRLVDSGAAVGSLVERNGRPTLHSLRSPEQETS